MNAYGKITIATLALALGAAETRAQADKAQEAAAGYFEALFSGKVEAADALCQVPFSLDRKKILKTVRIETKTQGMQRSEADPKMSTQEKPK